MNDLRITKMILKHDINVDLRYVNEYWNKKCVKLYFLCVCNKKVTFTDNFIINIGSFNKLQNLKIHNVTIIRTIITSWKYQDNQLNNEIINFQCLNKIAVTMSWVRYVNFKTFKRIYKFFNLNISENNEHDLYGLDLKVMKYIFWNEYGNIFSWLIYNDYLHFLDLYCIKKIIFIFGVVGMRYVYGKICKRLYINKCDEDLCDDIIYYDLLNGFTCSYIYIMFKHNYVDLNRYWKNIVMGCVYLCKKNLLRFVDWCCKEFGYKCKIDKIRKEIEIEREEILKKWEVVEFLSLK